MSVRIEIELPGAGVKCTRRPTKPEETSPTAAAKHLTAAYREAMDWLVGQGARRPAAEEEAARADERRRQAAYLYAVVQSGEEGDGYPSNVVEFGYDAGIIYAARLLLDNEAGVNDWPSDASEFELEIRERSAPGKSVVADAAEWLALREQDDDNDSAGAPVAAGLGHSAVGEPEGVQQ